jgi:hypothetical protein
MVRLLGPCALPGRDTPTKHHFSEIVKDNDRLLCVLHYPILKPKESCYGKTGEICNISISHPADVFGGLSGMSLVDLIP